ncbi:MAG: RNA-dependent DNA polymerase, partial [Opitutae bacterium]|nr:RNA-dependent DNA polymerase [Opitutae bacterium]
FSLHLEREVLRLHRDLVEGRYRHGRYTLFEVQDPKPRAIAAASFKDRVVHHAAHDVIEPALDRMFIHDSYACRRGKGTQAALDRAQHYLRSAGYSLHLDVQRCFQCIDHGILKAILRRYVADDALIRLLDQIIDSTVYLAETGYCDSGGRRITERLPMSRDLFGEPVGAADAALYRGLPLGNVTSQLFANLYMNELDQFLKHRLRVRRYVRYMDDMVLFHDDKAVLLDAEAGIRHYAAQRLRLVLHPSGGPLAAKHGRPFLGFRLFRTHRRLRGRPWSVLNGGWARRSPSATR